MNKEKYIKDIIGKTVKDYGFEKFLYDVDGWVEGYAFVKKEKDLIQYISMTVIDNKIRLEFRTNVYGQLPVYASNLMNCGFINDGCDFLLFKNKEEFEKILYYFQDIIVRDGTAILEKISKPITEVRPTKETYWKVYTENKELEEKYRKMYGLEDTEFTRKMMQKISNILLSIKDKEFVEVEEMLVGLAAVYGNQIIRKCGGKWRWKDNTKSCLIEEIYGQDSANPLNDIIFYWNRKEEDIYILLIPFKKHPYDTVI